MPHGSMAGQLIAVSIVISASMCQTWALRLVQMPTSRKFPPNKRPIISMDTLADPSPIGLMKRCCQRFLMKHNILYEKFWQDQPFMIYLPLILPHSPVTLSQPYKGRSDIGPYGDLVIETDAMVGQIMATLEETGQADNTLVIFTSDNGPEWEVNDDIGVYRVFWNMITPPPVSSAVSNETPGKVVIACHSLFIGLRNSGRPRQSTTYFIK